MARVEYLAMQLHFEEMMHTKSITMMLLLLVAGCGLLNGGDTPDESPIDWPAAVDCIPDDAVISIIDVVGDILFSRPGSLEIEAAESGQLEDLARKHTPAVVACAVEFVINELTRPGASTNEGSRMAALRGRDFLSDVGTDANYATPTGQQ
jgi:hypothetical protein